MLFSCVRYEEKLHRYTTEKVGDQYSSVLASNRLIIKNEVGAALC